MAVKIRRLRTDKKQFFTVRVYRVSLVGLQNGRFVVGTIPGAEPRILRVLWFNWVKKVSTAFACKYTAKRFVFLCIQVCANSQTKGLERVLKWRARQGRTLKIRALGVWGFARGSLSRYASSNWFWEKTRLFCSLPCKRTTRLTFTRVTT